MAKKMLIDAAHPEETRVAVSDGNRLEEFDYESDAKRQLRGNIYLAKVTRVEPSLQAAFVDYGGNRHGFLAFNEIHPDYYQIPFEDREKLREAEAEIEGELNADPIEVEDGGTRCGSAEVGRRFPYKVPKGAAPRDLSATAARHFSISAMSVSSPFTRTSAPLGPPRGPKSCRE